MSQRYSQVSIVDHDHAPMPEPAPEGASPGKRSLTQGLSPRSIIFRVESAEAARELGAAFGPRDRNGVADGAEGAVDRAATGSGAVLRSDLRERFESSLGADLSAVRVHTGEGSAEASTAVGARAYTVGNDIHFGRGQYQPDDPFGMHLIAHEVAHTQQQAGGSPHRQHKLEVSTPGDAAEVEADRAADAMVSGRAASVGSGGGLARQEAAKAPLAATVSIQKNGFTIEITASEDGKVSVSGGAAISGAVQTPIPGVFVEGELSAKVTGEGLINADGSASFGVGSEITGQVTLNGGVPQVASVYGGGAVSLKFPGITVTRSAAGKWDGTIGGDIALTCKAVVGAKIEALDKLGLKDALPGGWNPDLKWEFNPGGEKELLVFSTKTGKFSKGKDVDALIAKVDAALIAVGARKGAKLESGATKPLQEAAARAVAKAKAEQDRRTEEQHKRDRDEYNAEHNPKAQQSHSQPTLDDELDSCEPPPEC